MQRTELQSGAAPEPIGAPCPSCGLFVAPALLACPQCRALVHRAELEQIAEVASAASTRGELAEAMAGWRRALLLLPSESKQYAQITGTIRGLRERLDAGAPPGASPSKAASSKSPVANEQAAPRLTGWRRFRAAISSGLAVVLFKLKSIWLLLLTGWKPLLLGLTKLGTLSSMLLSLGVYWKFYGWQFALGLVVCIYVHEIGHVVALKRLGIAASSPMFIPGFGAVVRLHQYPIDADEEAQVGLAGPRWGLGVSLVAFLVARLTHSDALGAIAKVSAWINLFNLIPIPPLDGGRGFRALGNQQRLLCAAVLGVVYYFTKQGFVGVIAVIALFRSFERRKEPNPTANLRVLIEYAGLAIMLSVLAMR
jgi:Zn-dependent protease